MSCCYPRHLPWLITSSSGTLSSKGWARAASMPNKPGVSRVLGGRDEGKSGPQNRGRNDQRDQGETVVRRHSVKDLRGKLPRACAAHHTASRTSVEGGLVRPPCAAQAETYGFFHTELWGECLSILPKDSVQNSDCIDLQCVRVPAWCR